VDMGSTAASPWLCVFLLAPQLIQASCNIGNRDCSCADASFAGCSESGAAQNAIHTKNLEECIFQCKLFHTYGTCDYLLFYKSGPNQNCHLFYGAESLVLEDYLQTCEKSGQPLFNANNDCFSDPQGDCPSEACSGPCFNCGQEEGDCSGVRFLSSFPVKSLLVCGHCTLNSHCAQGVRVQHDHSRARISRHAKQGRMSATLH